MKIKEPIFKITTDKKVKRSWDFVRDTLKKGGFNIDLRKASKVNIPLQLTAICCDTILNIRKKKDFPLRDKQCKCGKTKLVEWIIKK